MPTRPASGRGCSTRRCSGSTSPGFTALSERLAERGKLGAEELIVLISRCYSGLIDIAERYGGDVLKFRGDALLLLFDGDGHEERAALAALAMQGFIADGRERRVERRTGASSAWPAGSSPARATSFLLGRHHRELIVCGPSASATLELEDAAESGEILVSRAPRRRCRGFVGEPTRRRVPPAARRERRAELPPPPDERAGRRRPRGARARRRCACRSKTARSRPSTGR